MGRAPCCDKDGMKKGPWLPEEDQKLIDYIEKHGPGNWRNLPKKAGLQRCGKSCRLRWTNYLRPDIKRGRFSFEEEETIIQLHSVLGNKWSAIATKLPGRTDNEIKNYWNTHIRKRMLRMGIDPVTHTHRLDLSNIPSILSSLLQNSSQLNLLKLLSLQTLANNNPQLLRLATLLSTSQNQNQNQNLNFLLQNNLIPPNNDQSVPNYPSIMQNNQHNYTNAHQTVPNCSTPLSNLNCANNTQVINPNLEQNPKNISTFEAHNNIENQWQNDVGFAQDIKDVMQSHMNNGISSDEQAFMDRLFDNSAFMLDHNKQSLNIPSMFSSPCSSQQTPLSSNSMYPNGSSTSSSSCEDENDSYCDNLLDYDIPIDLFDVGRSC